LHLTFQFDLRPTRAQQRALERILEGQRLVYNAALQERIEAWRKAAKSIGLYDQYQSLTTIRADDPDGYGALPVALSRWALKKVDLAFKAFFARMKARKERAGFPRYRGKDGWLSFGFAEFSGIRLRDDRLLFAGLALKVWMHRPLPAGASLRSCVFTKGGRRWTVSLQVELPEAATVHAGAGRAVGLDWGVEIFATLSDGETIANPRLGTEMAGDIRRAQRALSRRKRGSKRREKARRHLQRLQRKLADRRQTFLHQRSARLTTAYGMIAVENLTVRNMTRSAKGSAEAPGKNVRQKAGLNREILDVSPSMFAAMLRYKAERAGGQFAAVDSRGTSIACSACGEQVPKGLSIRMHACPRCNLRIHRDLNAARNVLGRAVAGPWSGFGVYNGETARRRSGIVRAA
jgi:putative transposase